MWAEFGSDRFVRAGRRTSDALRDAGTVKAAGGETKMLDDAIAEVTAENVRCRADRHVRRQALSGDLGGEAAGTADDLDDAAER